MKSCAPSLAPTTRHKNQLGNGLTQKQKFTFSSFPFDDDFESNLSFDGGAA